MIELKSSCENKYVFLLNGSLDHFPAAYRCADWQRKAVLGVREAGNVQDHIAQMQRSPRPAAGAPERTLIRRDGRIASGAARGRAAASACSSDGRGRGSARCGGCRSPCVPADARIRRPTEPACERSAADRQRHAPVTAGLKARCASPTPWPDGSRHGFGSRPGRWAARKVERRAAATYPPRRTGPTRVGMRARPRDRSARRHLAGDGTSVKPEQSLDRRPVCQRFGAQAAGMAWDPVTDPAHPPFNAGAQRKRPSRRAGP